MLLVIASSSLVVGSGNERFWGLRCTNFHGSGFGMCARGVGELGKMWVWSGVGWVMVVWVRCPPHASNC